VRRFNNHLHLLLVAPCCYISQSGRVNWTSKWIWILRKRPQVQERLTANCLAIIKALVLKMLFCVIDKHLCVNSRGPIVSSSTVTSEFQGNEDPQARREFLYYIKIGYKILNKWLVNLFNCLNFNIMLFSFEKRRCRKNSRELILTHINWQLLPSTNLRDNFKKKPGTNCNKYSRRYFKEH
jgi:hypothetical protein